MSDFKTTAAYISGAIYGALWWPAGAEAYIPVKANMRGAFGIMGRVDGLDSALELFLNENGGDFQGAQFTADSELVIERKAIDGNGRYRIHIRTIPLSRIVPDYVGNKEACDIMCDS